MNYVQNHHLDCPIFVNSPSYYKFSQSRNALNLSNQNTMYCSTKALIHHLVLFLINALISEKVQLMIN